MSQVDTILAQACSSGIGRVENPISLLRIIAQLLKDGSPLVYRALLTQSGNPNQAPTAIVLQNTLGAVTFAYMLAGQYEIRKTGAFDFNKVAILMEPLNLQSNAGWQCNYQDANSLTLNSYDLSTFPAVTPQDGVFNNTFIQILVYP